MIKNLAGAKAYINNIKNGLIKHPFVNKDGLDSLKIFAEKRDEENFRIIVNFMKKFISTNKDYKIFKKEPLANVELLCETIDNGYMESVYAMYQSYRGFKVKRFPLGKTQKFFQKLYGPHFFKKK